MIHKLSGTRLILAMLFVLALPWPFFVQASEAAVINVTNLNDSGAGSLRNAIETASPGDEIQFSVTGTINLSSGALSISQNLTLTGPEGGVTLDAGYSSQVLIIKDGSMVNVSNLTIAKGGNTPYGAGVAVLYTPSGDALSRDAPAPITSLTMYGCTIQDCQASTSSGGIYNQGELTLTNCTVSGNNARYDSGGIKNRGTLTLLNTTITANTVTSTSGVGAAIYSTGLEEITVKNSIIAGNGQGEPLVTEDGLVAGKEQAEVSNLFISGTAVNSLGYNIVGDDATNDFIGQGDVINNNPMLGPLADNGGPTMTHLPQANSPAIDAGTNTEIPSTDQRGVTRPQDGDGDGTATCDIGSVEVGDQEPGGSLQSPPVANGQHVKVQKDVAKSITLTGSDHDGDALTYEILTQPSLGSLTGAPPSLTYTRTSDLISAGARDSFTFLVNDGTNNSAPATVTLEAFVDPAVSQVPPVANNQIVSTPSDTPVNITLTGSDNDGASPSYVTQSDPLHGTLSGTAPNLTYSPNSGFIGSDYFKFQAYDTSLRYSESAYILIKVGAYSGEYPVAVAVHPFPDITPLASTMVDGSRSYDPLGRNLLYQWSITNTNDFSITNTSSVQATVRHTSGAGSETNCVLTVTNPDGLSDTAVCPVEVPFGSAAASGLLFGLCALAGVRSIRRKNQRGR